MEEWHPNTLRCFEENDAEDCMIKSGIVSVGFRQHSAEEVITLATYAGLEGIEWGGDVHVPHGCITRAREVGERTRDSGLTIEAYGSYYRAGAYDAALSFEKILETTIALGAPRIRAWAGVKPSSEATIAERNIVVKDLKQCAESAKREGLVLALEFHPGTLTDTAESAAALMQELQDVGVRLYWQPPPGMPYEEAGSGLEMLLPWIDNVHVFHWIIAHEELQRLPLKEGEKAWHDYLDILTENDKDRWAMLEFVKSDDPLQLFADAATLREWIEIRKLQA